MHRSYNKHIQMYGAELTNPINQEFLLQIASFGQYGVSLEMPRAMAKVRFAPLEPNEVRKATIVIGLQNIPV
jgi:hypothetical protein